MRTFEGIGEGNCKICGTGDPGKVCLIGIDGTGDGSIEEAVPVHIDCIELRYHPELNLLYQQLKKE